MNRCHSPSQGNPIMTICRALKGRIRYPLTMLCAAALAGAVSAASQGPDGAAKEAELLRLIGDAACTDDAQCRTVGFGAKACGGPQSYLAWSSLRTDESALGPAAAAVEASQRREIERRGIASNCSVLVDPGAYCERRVGGAADGTSPSGPGVCRLMKRSDAKALQQ